MKIIYLLNQRFPTEKAYGRQIAKMCSNFSKISGMDLELIYPTRQNLIKDDPFSYYQIKNNFKVTKAWSPDFYWRGKLDVLAFSIKNLISALILVRVVLNKNPDIVYSRDELALYALSFLRKNLIFEAHKFQISKGFIYRRFNKDKLKIIAITQSLKDEFVKLGFNPANILVASDGVDAEVIEKEEKIPSDIISARRILSLPLDKKVAVYTGSLYRWKGIYVLADSAKLYPDILFIVVGGDERGDETAFTSYLEDNHIDNVKVTGYIRSEEAVMMYLSAADVLVLPNSGKDIVSARYTSPLKLFSYMAVRRPIVASSLQSLREILNEENSVLVEPDNASALANGIRKVVDDNFLADKIRQNAFEDVRQYTWEKRAQKILNFING